MIKLLVYMGVLWGAFFGDELRTKLTLMVFTYEGHL